MGYLSRDWALEPAFTKAFAGVPARMHQVVPNAKLLFMVRDPLARLVSHWMHNYSNGR